MSQNKDNKLPSKFGVLLFPTFEPLDAFGPIEVFQGLSWTSKIELALIGPTLEPVNTALPADSPFTASGPSYGVQVVPTHTYDNPPEDLEVLLVPGGVGVLSPNTDGPVDFIRKIYPKLKYLIVVCNGAGLVARSGVLDGRRATTTKAMWKYTTEVGPKVNWVKTARYVVDGNCWSSSGVSAGLDVAFAWIAHVYGEERARDIANRQEYEWRDDKNWDPFTYVWGVAQPDSALPSI